MFSPKTIVLFFALFIASGQALECHTCNSQNDPGCAFEKFNPKQSTNQHKKCEDSFKHTFQQTQAILFPTYHDFPVERLMVNNKSTDACIKYTVTDAQTKKSVTFRGCSVLGDHSCTLTQSLITTAGGISDHCHQCANKQYCNDANSKVPFVSAVFMAAVALVLSIKF
ncbi:uncharacterized protein LOC132198318 [Neocloeon triangulifer]|uniref:uncharacterized protein LOC132198318 n=1 Tax=Neocloeon triangulifer TaxID=2078957 RepID=UPI00286FABF2|nr:uncharacterized protein LOC132198318 [Neocloeon triangulifer]